MASSMALRQKLVQNENATIWHTVCCEVKVRSCGSYRIIIYIVSYAFKVFIRTSYSTVYRYKHVWRVKEESLKVVSIINLTQVIIISYNTQLVLNFIINAFYVSYKMFQSKTMTFYFCCLQAIFISVYNAMDNAFVKECSIKIEPDTLYPFNIIMCFKYYMIKLVYN